MSCKDLFQDVDEVTEVQRLIIDGGSCLDPEFAVVENTRVYSEIYKTFEAHLSEALESEEVIMFYSYNIFDSSEPDRPIKRNIKQKFIPSGKRFGYSLTMHQVELNDNIYSPFSSPQNLSYLNMEEIDLYDFPDSDKRQLNFQLSDDIVIEKRIRYNVWDLLGDVGGFNDGLILVCQLLTGAYTAASFKTKFLASIFYDSNRDDNQ